MTHRAIETGSRVKETISAGGTGNLTLSGAVSNFQTFNTEFGTNRDFYYWIVDGTTAWECGVGHLSASTTLVRHAMIASSTGSVIDATTAAVVFSAAPSATNDPMSAEIVTRGAYGKIQSSLHIMKPTQDSNVALTVNKYYMHPFMLLGGILCSGIGLEIGAVGTGAGNARAALWKVDSDGEPGDLVVESGNINCGSTGASGINMDSSVTDIWIPPGWYFAGVITDNASATFAKNDLTYIMPSLVGGLASNGDPYTSLSYSTAKAWTTGGVDDPFPASPSWVSSTAGAPKVFLESF